MIYLISNGEHFKIGIAKNPTTRFKALQTGSSKQLQVIALYDTNATIQNTATLDKQVETRLHNMFKEQRLKGEWFNLSNEDIQKIDNYCQKLKCIKKQGIIDA